MSPRTKPVTLEQIFDKLTDHDKQFEKVFDKFTNHDKQFANITNRLLNFEDSVARDFERLGKRITAIEIEENSVKQIEKLEQEYHAITLALKRIETNLDRPGKSHELGKNWTNVNKRMTTLEKRVQVLESK